MGKKLKRGKKEKEKKSHTQTQLEKATHKHSFGGGGGDLRKWGGKTQTNPNPQTWNFKMEFQNALTLQSICQAHCPSQELTLLQNLIP